MTDTPETDAMECYDAMCDPDRVVEAGFARKLERERDEWKEKCDRLAEALNELWYNHSLTGSSYELIEQALQFINKPTQ